jgi:hypothetical protein
MGWSGGIIAPPTLQPIQRGAPVLDEVIDPGPVRVIADSFDI